MKYALIIANSEYTDPKLEKLSAPSKDAEKFARVLEDTGIGAFDNVTVLINRSLNDVRNAINDLFENEKKTEDLLLLYFSGHGIRDENGALYLAVSDTNRKALLPTAVEDEFISKLMKKSRSKKQLIILDCCNSGAFAKGTKGIGDSMGIATALKATSSGQVVITASDATQLAWEGDKVIGNVTQNSLFTHFLIKGLEGEADKTGNGKITVDDLYDYAFAETTRATPNQTPCKFGDQKGEIVLRERRRAQNSNYSALPIYLIDLIESNLVSERLQALKLLVEYCKNNKSDELLLKVALNALETIAIDDDSSTVRRFATDELEYLDQKKIINKRESELEAKRKAALDAEAKRNAALDAEAKRKAALDAEAKRKAALDAEAKRKAALDAEAKRKAALDAEAKRKAALDAEAKRKAALDAEAKRKAALDAEAKRKAALDAEAKRKVNARNILIASTVVLIFSFLVIYGLKLLGTTPTNVKSTDLLNKIISRGYILVSSDPNYQPQSFFNAEGQRPANTKCPSDALTTSEMQGFDVDVAIAIGDGLGIETCFATPSWDAIGAGNWADKWDVSVGSMTITTTRQAVLDFSVPYYYTPAVVAVAADSSYDTLESLTGQALCAGVSTTYESWLNNDMDALGLPESSIYAKVPAGVTVVPLDSDQDCAQSIAAGRTDFVGYVTSDTVVDANLAAGLPVRKLEGVVYSEDVAAAFDKSSSLDSTTLREKVDEIFTIMHNDGKLSSLSNKWFGMDVTQSPK